MSLLQCFFPCWPVLAAMITLVAAASVWAPLHPVRVQYRVACSSSPLIPLTIVGSLWLSSLVGAFVCLCQGHFLIAGWRAVWLGNDILLLLGGCWIAFPLLCACYSIWDASLFLGVGDGGWVTMCLSRKTLLKGVEP